jgi:hypothetical protein
VSEHGMYGKAVLEVAVLENEFIAGTIGRTSI